MHPAAQSNTGMFTQLISDARAAEEEHIKPGDEERLFYKLAWWKKVIVMAGGPTVNLLIAFFIFAPIFALYGNPDPEEAVISPVVDEVAPCIVPAAEDGPGLHGRGAAERPDPGQPGRPAAGRRVRRVQRRDDHRLGAARNG